MERRSPPALPADFVTNEMRTRLAETGNEIIDECMVPDLTKLPPKLGSWGGRDFLGIGRYATFWVLIGVPPQAPVGIEAGQVGNVDGLREDGIDVTTV